MECLFLTKYQEGRVCHSYHERHADVKEEAKRGDDCHSRGKNSDNSQPHFVPHIVRSAKRV